MAISWTQNVVVLSTTTSVTSLTATYTNAINAGDLLIIFCRAGSTYTNTTVSDNINGTWTLVTGNGADAIFYFIGSKAASAGGLTVTVSNTASAAIKISADNFTGVGGITIDTSSSNSGAAGTTWTAPSITTGAGELIYAGASQKDAGITATAGTTNGVAMTLSGQGVSGVTNEGWIATEYLLSSTAGSQNSSMTLSPATSSAISGIQVAFNITSITYTLAIMGVGY